MHALKVLPLFALLIATCAPAADWYVGPEGTKENPGTKDAPWDLASTLAGQRPVQPGDTVWVMEGVYKHPVRATGNGFEVKLKGSPEQPVHVKPYQDQRVQIDGGLSVTAAEYLWIWGLEVYVSENMGADAGRREDGLRWTNDPGSHPGDRERPWGSVNITGAKNCKFINLLVHDNSQGIGFWKGATDCELHGNVIYDNGWVSPDRAHGPAIYTQNQAGTGTKTIDGNLILQSYSLSMQAYGSANAWVDNYVIADNAFLLPMTASRAQFRVGGGRASNDIVVKGNLLHRMGMTVGTAAGSINAEVVDNVIVFGGLGVNHFDPKKVENNTVYTAQNAPQTPIVKVMPNKYDERRANLAIVNPAKTPTVEVELAPFLKAGDKYEIRQADKYFEAPVVTGTYTGKVTIPLAKYPNNADYEAGAFVVLKR